MLLPKDIFLYKGFGDLNQSPIPPVLATKGSLHFTPYLSVAEFYSQNGFIATYLCPFQVDAQPHPDNTGPPFNFHAPDYQVILIPSQILLLKLISTTPSYLLPGSVIIGPNSEITFKDINPPIIFTNPTPYNKSHFN